MKMLAVFISLRLALGLYDLNPTLALNSSGDDLKQMSGCTDAKVSAVESIKVSSVLCKLQGTTHLPVFSMDGDYVIGGVFSMHYNMKAVEHNYTTMPGELTCTGRIEPLELHFSSAMIFAIEEINNSTKLLPGIRLGYQIHDACASVPMAVKVAFQLTNGLDHVVYTCDNCSQSGMVMAIVGASGSTPSISISRVIGSFNVPQVSHFATCACLSNKQQYPSFFRTIPSDHFQADALAKLVKQFGWTWIGAVRSDSDYGNNGMATFLNAAQKQGICVEYSESFSRTHPRSRIQRVADVIRRSTATVLVAFLGLGEMSLLMEELSREPSPPRQWIGSEAWMTHRDMLKFTFCAGAIGFGIPRSVIPGLRDFLLDLSPTKVAASPILSEFWEEAFNCSLEKSDHLTIFFNVYFLGAATDKTMCDGSEDIQNLQSPYSDTSELRVTNMVYKAVYAIAHAIHNAVCQEKNSTTQCDKLTRKDSKQILTELQKVNFSQNGYHVSFDANGDPVAMYELVNWQKSSSGSLEMVTVGYYDASLPVGQEFHIYKNLTWMEGRTQVPVSVCSDSCPPGTHKVLQKGKPICCYDCLPCPEGEISNVTDSPNCFPCLKEFWPNTERDTCFPKPVEFLSFSEVLGIILATFSIGGACLAVTTATVFFWHRTSPIVRANNSELSFLLLFSLTLCFLCSLTFIGAPSEWSCMLRHTAFGITFVLCISCVLGKTIVVLMAFKATLPGSNVMKWFGPPQQRMTVVSFTFIQVLICTVWLVLSPPFPMKNLTTYKEKIILECALGSSVAFWTVLGYIGLLAVFCFVLAVLARKLPDNFNEAKLITFSMLIFCAVWITFIPAYVSSPGKFTVAVEIFAILASSFGLMLCIFAPKCFIILFKPEKNTKKHLMNKNYSGDDLKQMSGCTYAKASAVESIKVSSVLCKLQGTTHLPVFSMDGDYVIGGVFSIHYNMKAVEHNYTTMPGELTCTGRIEPRELHFSSAMIFAIEEINNSTKLLPGIRLGYQIHDSCASVPMAVKVAFQLTNGLDHVFYTCDNCSQSGMVMAIVGASGSTPSISMSRVIGSFNVPQVSHFATCACLSNKQQYPSFLRTIPSDHFQADALAKLVKQFGWTWIGAVRSDSDYGNNGMATFLKAALKQGICVEYSESFSRTHPRSRIQRVADVIRRSTATVLVAFLGLGEMRLLMEELSREPSPPRQWIGSEAWMTHPDMLKFTFCAGAIGFGIPRSVIPGLRDFLLDLSPTKVAASPILTEFWEDAFNCTLEKSDQLTIFFNPYILGSATDKTMCDGSEDIQNLQTPYTDTSELRITNMVYKAVYAIAHAIHNAVCQKTNSTTQCDKLTRIDSKQILTELKKVNFSQNGYHVSFDDNGDPVAMYELVNWQKSSSGSLEMVTVGYYDASLPVGQEFHIYKNLTWMEGRTQVPVSVCSDNCSPGTHKVLQKGKPICCYDCIPCPEGEISNATDSTDCFPCPKEFWPNTDRNTCFPKPVEFLSFSEVLGIILATFSIGGACLAVITATVFFRHRTSPIVRANNSELSFLLLFSLTLCFLCSLTFIGAPSEWSCMLRHTAFGITFVLCISCVLGKTIVVLMAFKATLPGSNVMKWFGPPQQRMTVVSFTFVQVLICTVWLVLSPPFPMKNLTTYKEKIILECALGSSVAFWTVLGYIGLLAFFCFVLAVLARKLPDNFNEAKLITFSMLIFCAVWITFIPAYVSSPGKFTVAVEIFALLASSFGLILCIFAPKCFIILFKPEKNTKKHVVTKYKS
ncbi:uncharacterized protein LOC113165072 [Anabas testudineus]|uniref:uncharacterized protein LOC113165072 n=1 Tax=Anabas testudineus TaxID=64144 RepID=UPI000E46457F|nr:uncharacterized protein LOC113165072 [Anabas testudineus]